MAQIVELYPQEILVNINGDRRIGKSVSAALFVHWQAPNGTLQMATGELDKIKLKSGVSYRRFPTNSPENIFKHKLIKTLVQGPSIIKAEIIVAKKPALLEAFIAAVVNSGLSAISITNPLLAAARSVVSSSIQSEIKKHRIVSLGVGYWEFDPLSPPVNLNIELKAPETIYALHGRDDHGMPISDPNESKVELLGKGETNGNISLRVNYYQA